MTTSICVLTLEGAELKHTDPNVMCNLMWPTVPPVNADPQRGLDDYASNTNYRLRCSRNGEI